MRVLSADLRHVLFFNFEVAPHHLAPFLRKDWESDPYEGQHYLSLVAGVISQVKVMGLLLSEYQSFSQIQLQCYVKQETPKGRRQGTFVLRRWAPQLLTQRFLRLWGSEETQVCQTRHELRFEEGGVGPMGKPIADAVATYEWQISNEWQGMMFRASGLPAPLSFGGIEAFVARRPYRFFPKGQFKVEHPEWFYWEGAKAEFYGEIPEETLQPFRKILKSPPSNAFLAKGSAIKVLTRCVPV